MARLPERLAAVEARNPVQSNIDLSGVPTSMLEKLACLKETRPLPPIEDIFTPDEIEIWKDATCR